MVEFIKKLIQGEFLRTFLVIGSTLILGMGLNYAISALLSNKLSVIDFGIWSYTFQSVITILVVFSLYGNGNFLMRELIRMISAKRWKDAVRVTKESIAYSLLFTLLAIGFILFGKDVLYKGNAINTSFLIGVSVALIVLVFGRIRQAYQQATGQNAISQFPEKIIQPILFVIILFIWLGFDVEWNLSDAMLAYAAASVTTLIISLVPLKKISDLRSDTELEDVDNQEVHKVRFTQDKVTRKHFFWLSLVDIVDTGIDLFLLKSFIGIEEVAYYSVAKRVASLVNIILYASNYTISPIVNKHVATGNLKLLQTKLFKVVKLNMLLAGVLVVILLVTKDFLLGVFGANYAANISITLYVLLLVNQFVNIALGMPGVLLNATGNERYSLYTFSLSIVLQVVLAYWMLPKYGVEAMAGIFCCITIFWNITLGIIAKRKTGIRASFFIS